MRYFKSYLVLLLLTLYSCSPRTLLTIDSTLSEKKTLPTFYDYQQQFKQITTHPEVDLMPAVSPDGKWIAFATRRSGNMDIWVKPVIGGRAIQITSHQTDDLYPCWSPEGKTIVFVSYREDAAGDLWQIKIDAQQDMITVIGKPKKLTSYLGLDASPAFSPDGKTIAFTSDRDGQRNIWFYNVSSKRTHQLTYHGGMNPTWSPDGKHIAFASFRNGNDSGGDIFVIDLPPKKKLINTILLDDNAKFLTRGASLDALPCWSPLKNEIAFTRYSRDTNNDGKVTPDDQPSLWKVNVTDTTTLQLTPFGYHDYFPFWGKDDYIYFISDRSGNQDIWSIHSDGPVPKQEYAFIQYQFADLYFPLVEEVSIFAPLKKIEDKDFLYFRLLAFQRVTDYYPADSTWIGFAEYEVARTYSELKNFESANKYYTNLLKIYQDRPEIIGNVYYELLKYDIQIHKNDVNYLEEKIETGYQLKNQFFNDQKLIAKLELTIGELYFYINEKLLALQVYEKLRLLYPEEREYCAIAQTRIAEIYTDFGQQEEVINSFLKVIALYPDQERWINEALEQIFEIFKKNDVYATLAAYHNIIEKYANYPRLAARAHYKIGEILIQQKDCVNAIDELSLIKKNYPDQSVEIARTELLISEAYLKNNDDFMAINNLKKIIENFGNVESGLYVVMAMERLIEIYLNTGRVLNNEGDYKLAFYRFQGAIKLQPNNLEAHRGLVFCFSRLGKINEAIEIYKQKVSQNPEDEIALYVLGLCYSYKATEKSERENKISALDYTLIKESNQIIEDALVKNYQLIPAYLALSYNYEVIEKYESYERNKPKGFLTRTLKTISAPIVSVFRIITFQKEKPLERWYEKAIDALTTAIALNDEIANPTLESGLALNLAHNYYNLEEFGYEKAYYYYKIKFKYDTTFIDLKNKARVYECMGHCALVLEDFKEGPKYLRKAIKLYQDLGNEQQMLLNIKRLALLYQQAGKNDESIEYFRKAVDIELRQKRWSELEQIYRSIAYNYQLLNDEEEAIRYAYEAVNLLKSGKIKEIKAKPNWIKIGILGIEFPVWNLGTIGAGESTAIEGFTTAEESALVYSILTEAYLNQKNILKAIEYYQKRLNIYRQRKDKIAEAIFLNNIAYLYYLDEDYINAWKYFENSLQICKKEELTAGILSNIVNLGTISITLNKINYPVEFDYSNRCLNHIINGLGLYSKEDIGFQKDHVQLLIILGNLHYLQYENRPDSINQSTEHQIIKFTRVLESLTESERNFQQALKLAEEYNYLYEKIIIYHNLGQIYFSVAEDKQAVAYFNKARILSIENNFTDMLWRIDFAIANLLAMLNTEQRIELNVKNEADFYFKEAIAVLEVSSLRKENFNPTQTFFQNVENLYENAIIYFISKQPQIALMLSERMRAKEYLDIFSSQRVELKKERHKNSLGNVRYDNRKIAEEDEKIRAAKLDPQTTKSHMDKLLNERQKYLNEYSISLKELKDEDPELELMVLVNPIPITDFQQILSKNSVVINYVITEDSTYVWLINSNHIKLQTLHVGKRSVENDIDSFLLEISNDSSEHQILMSSQNLFDNLILPFAELLKQYENVIIIPDDKLCFVPFNYLIKTFCQPEYSSQAVVLAPSLSSYYYRFQKRKIMETKVFSVGTEKLNRYLIDLGYTTTSFQSQLDLKNKEIKQKFEDGDIIHLTATMDWNNADPMMSRLKLPAMKPILEKEIYSFDLKASLLILNGDIFQQYPDAVNFNNLSRTFFYAGTPTILYTLWQVNQLNKGKFFRYFYDFLWDNSPAQALSLAQETMKKDGASMIDWSGYQLVGFQGMTDDEEKLFAYEQLERKVKSGYQSFMKKDWNEAIRDYEQALSMARKLGNENHANILRQEIIEAAINSSNFIKVIEYQKEILVEAENRRDIQAMEESYAALIFFLTENKKFDDAIFYQNKYIEDATTYHFKVDVPKSNHNLGLIYEKGGNYLKAIEYYGKSLKAYQKAGDMLGIAKNLKDRARIYFSKLNNYDKAIEDQLQALTFFQKEGDDESVIEVFQNIGLCYEKMDDYRAAIEYQSKALQLAQDIDEEHQIAISNQYIANVKWKLGDYQVALQHQKKALEQFEKIGNDKLQLMGLSTQGLIMMSLGQLEDGLNSEFQALALAEKIDDKQDQATIRKNIGLIYIANDQFSLASAEFQKALKIDEDINYKHGLAWDYLDLGSLFINMNYPDSAIIYLRQALVLSKEIQDSRNETKCYYELGRTNFALNRTKAALDSLQLAVEKSNYLLIPDIEWRALRVQGQIYYKLGQFKKAVEKYQHSVSVIEKMRSRIKIEELKSGFIDDKIDAYSDLILLLLRMNEPGQALEIVERAKSRSFLDMLANRDISFGSKVSDQLLGQGRAIQEEIIKIQVLVGNLRLKQSQLTVPENERLINLETKLSQLKIQYSNYLVNLKAENAELAEMVSVEPRNTSEIQSILPDNTALLEYYYTNEKITIWAITNKGVNFAIVDQPDSVLRKLVEEFRSIIAKRRPINPISNQLHTLLIMPVSEQINQITHLIIVPYGVLHYLPFAALLDNDGKYLIENHTLSLAPSATVLGFCIAKGAKYQTDSGWERKILALGNPELGDPNLALPFAEKEIESIKLVYPNVLTYLKNEATETIFKTTVDQANIVLLSCHGEFDASNPLFSSLLLTADDNNDGRLEAYEIFGLHFDAYLVAMSACETGLGAIRGGDEVVGLSRSFIYAGSASLLSSLWKVDDLATAVMIKRFFRYLKESNQTRADALRKAQLLIKSEINNHPAFWAAFYITGDFR